MYNKAKVIAQATSGSRREPFSRRGGILEGTGDCLLGRASALGDRVFLVPTLRLPDHGKHTIEEHIQDFCSVWFIVSEQSRVGFSLVSSSSPISSMISRSDSTLLIFSMPNRCRLADKELTSGLL